MLRFREFLAEKTESPLIKVDGDEWIINPKKDTYVHFSSHDGIKAIIKSKKLKSGKSTSVTGTAFAVSTSYGIFSPYLPSQIYKGSNDTVSAVIFSTNDIPSSADVGQVQWDRDVSIVNPKEIPFEEAKRILSYKRDRLVPVPADDLSAHIKLR